MFKIFYPTEYQDSVYTMNFEEIYKNGYRGLIFDIDNTLVEHGAAADERSVELFKSLRCTGFKTCVLSNNDEERVKPFADAVQTMYICKAGKPLSKNYKKSMDMLRTGKTDTLFIGDQVFTDIWGANNAGIRNVLVEPINKKEALQVRLKRYPEKLILFFYKRTIRRK